MLKGASQALLAHWYHAPFRVSRLELVLGLPLAALAWLSWHNAVWAADWYVDDIKVTLSSVQLEKLFGKYALLLAAIALLSAISLIRAIRNDVPGFTRLGHLALAWPLFLYQFLPSWYLGLGIAGSLLCIAAIVRALAKPTMKGDLIAALLGLACFVLGWMICWQWLSMVID